MASSILEFEKKYALLIGINSYADDIIGALNYSVADVNSLHDILVNPRRGSYENTNIRLMTDESVEPDLKPIRSNIMSAVSSVSSMATTKDSLLLYFSGHGIEKDAKNFLLSQDSRYNVISESAISIEWLKETLSASNARVKIIILDACHSGAIKGKEGSGVMSETFAKSLSTMPEGFATLSSCRQSEVSWEDPKLKHSVFSHFLTEGLKGGADFDKDKRITITDANKYTFEKVSAWAFAHSRRQSPNLECRILGDIMMCKVPEEYVPPSPIPLGITGIRLFAPSIPKDQTEKVYSQMCGLLLNYFNPGQITYEDEDTTTFPGGKLIISRGSIDGFQFTFSYNDESSQIIDRIISRIDDALRFDRIEFLFSSEVDLDYLVKSSRDMGLNIVSYNLQKKAVDVEVVSEKKEFDTVRFTDIEKGSSLLYMNEKAFFELGFYDRINPKTVAEFFAFLRKKT